jgi:hypothetical protein
MNRHTHYPSLADMEERTSPRRGLRRRVEEVAGYALAIGIGTGLAWVLVIGWSGGFR